jgi:hypothetical protein
MYEPLLICASINICIVIMQIEAQYLSAHYSPQAPDPACDSRAAECPCPQFPQLQVPPPTSDLRNARQNTRRCHRTHPSQAREAERALANAMARLPAKARDSEVKRVQAKALAAFFRARTGTVTTATSPHFRQ